MKIVQVVTDYIRRSILTTKGDLAVRGDSVPERLAAGAVNQILRGQGAGHLPIFGPGKMSDHGVHFESYTRATAGEEVLTGFGFQPSFFVVMAQDVAGANLNWSLGVHSGTQYGSVSVGMNGTIASVVETYVARINRDVDNYMYANVTSIESDGATIIHYLTGAVNMSVLVIAIE